MGGVEAVVDHPQGPRVVGILRDLRKKGAKKNTAKGSRKSRALSPRSPQLRYMATIR